MGGPDAVVWREMTDPVRWRTYLVLRHSPPLRAAQIAKLVGTSEAVMLRHLDVISDLGLVRSAPTQDEDTDLSPRRRRWEAVPGGLRFDPDDDTQPSPEVADFMRMGLSVQHDILQEFVSLPPVGEEEWWAATEMQDGITRLTLQELRELQRELKTVWGRYRGRGDGHDDRETKGEERRAVYVVTHAVLYPGHSD